MDKLNLDAFIFGSTGEGGYRPNLDASILLKWGGVIGQIWMRLLSAQLGGRRFEREPDGMCCLLGKVCLPPLKTPPEPLLTLLNGELLDSTHFFNNMRLYNFDFHR